MRGEWFWASEAPLEPLPQKGGSPSLGLLPLSGEQTIHRHGMEHGLLHGEWTFYGHTLSLAPFSSHFGGRGRGGGCRLYRPLPPLGACP
jgi:hypothetical protein